VTTSEQQIIGVGGFYFDHNLFIQLYMVSTAV
jgi:hypothetical protein